MKIAFLLAMAASLTLSTAAGAQTLMPQEAVTCLNGAAVATTNVPNDQTIVFNMRNGQMWRNMLKAPCPNMRFDRTLSQRLQNGQICSGQQILRVQQTGMICTLGDFTPIATFTPRH